MKPAALLLLAFLVPMPAFAGLVPPNFGSGSPAQRQAGDCALTFDDGPGPHTGQLLDILAQTGVKATFFVLGENVRRHTDLIRRMIAEGHEVENHSWDHPDMRHLDPAAREHEIEATETLLVSLGATPHFFRPPYGAYDPALVEEARRDGLAVMLWTNDSLDWRYHSVADLEGHALPAGQGAHGVFLFHDIHDTTIAAMPAVIGELASKGCHYVTVADWAARHSGETASIPPSVPTNLHRIRTGVRSWLEGWVR